MKILQGKHSKSELVIDSFISAKYLVSPFLNKDQVQLLHKLINDMVDVKQNFGSMSKEAVTAFFLDTRTDPHVIQQYGQEPVLHRPGVFLWEGGL